MAGTVTTTTTELPDSRVRLDVEVASDAVEREVQSAAQALGRDLKISGFRKGHVPPQVVMQRVGREAVLDEAVRRALPNWYEEALSEARLNTVGDPSVSLGDLPERGSPFAFTIEVGIRPPAKLGEYTGLEVGRREPEVSDDDVTQEIERMRESLASLETVERDAQNGDFIVIDFVGRIDNEPFEGGEARGYLLELGSGRFIPGFEDQLAGVKAGDERDVKVTFPEDYGAEQVAGRDAVFSVTVKEVKEKRLPELDDDFAGEAGGFDSLDELRQDIESKLRQAEERVIEQEFRQAAVDAAVENAKVDLPHELVHAKAHEMWHETAHRLQHQGVNPQQYLQLVNRTEEDLVTEAEPEAEQALKREAVLAAIVEDAKIEVSDEEAFEALREVAERGAQNVDEDALKRSFERAKEEGRDDVLREDIAMRKAVDLLVESAKPIPAGQAEAREKLWTPEKEAEEKSSKLWTPGS
ncbi:MAG TPA: trigger factor [Thermoleophilaceae bacterium]|nr:trigger factor [Thermoleophilaceae bacterium]